MKKVLAITGLLLLLNIPNLFAVTIDESVSGVDRYAVYIGANDGGKGRERLLYAGSDALAFRDTMTEIGGVTENNSLILIDPSKESIDKALQDISSKISAKSGHAKRSEFIFYYSGHSDENALLLGDTKYDYSKLKAAITEVPSDIHVVILDSCYSGNFIRTKGGQKRKPFLIDDSSVVTGHAYLSSSSDNESSQESDEIESSYFTNAMITGLRGAADTSGDNKVTLNELYSYAFSDTLSKTETSKAGPQHPNYNITLVGSGDLILSDLTSAEAMLSLSKEAKGKFIIRDANDKMVSEINKVAGQPIFMALPAGQYSATIIDDYSSKQGIFYLNTDQVYVLDQNSLTTIKRKNARLRGDTKEKVAINHDDDTLDLEGLDQPLTGKQTVVQAENISNYTVLEDFDDDLEDDDLDNEEKDEDYRKNHLFETDDDEFVVHVSFVPGLSFYNPDRETTNLSYGIVGSMVHNLNGFQISQIFNIATGDVNGIQIASVGNIASNELNGIQVSSIFNIAEQVNGPQVSGIFNIGTDISGSQVAGIFNLATDLDGTQVSGIFNNARDVEGCQVAGVFNNAENVQGTQVAGALNVANKIDGCQVGLINIANENSGITLGLLNFVRNGLFDFGFTWTSDDQLDFTFQNGSQHLYTIYSLSVSNKEFDDTFTYFANGIGLGTQFRFSETSLELEFLLKQYYFDSSSYPELDAVYSKMDGYEKWEATTVPMIKLNFNLFTNKYSAFFISTAFEFNTIGTNDIPFQLYKHNMCIEDDSTNTYVTFGAGVKIHF